MKRVSHIVYRREVHSLYECDCNDCTLERKRREKLQDRSCLSIPPSTAYLFDLIPSRHPQGSLARELMDKENVFYIRTVNN